MTDIEVKYLRDTEAAKLVGLGVQTLRNRRQIGGGPPYIKKGRSVRYRLADLVAWMEADKVDPER